MRQPRLLTLGLGFRPLEQILRLLSRSGCRLVADIRSNPSAAFPPHFSRHLLTPELERVGMIYRWFRELGTMSGTPERDLDRLLSIDDAPLYAPRLNHPDFQRELSELAGVAASTSVIVIAAEADPKKCYRQLLSDALFLKGVKVVHIIDEERDSEHILSEELQITDDGLQVYRAIQLGLSNLKPTTE